MFIERTKDNLGKSSHGGQSLYDHVIGCARIAVRILTDARFTPKCYPKRKRDQLLFSVFMHDLGKLDPDFQAMLRAARDEQPFPPKRVKHEASTLDFELLLAEVQMEVQAHLGEALGYSFTEPIDLDDTLAFAVSHHGLFYLSYEEREEQVLRRVRREWTVFNYGEKRRITLTDLLFDYHPLGGLVIITDLLGSFCYEQDVGDAEALIDRAHSLGELIDSMLVQGAVGTVEESVQQYDPRNYGLRDLMRLLAGGVD